MTSPSTWAVAALLWLLMAFPAGAESPHLVAPPDPNPGDVCIVQENRTVVCSTPGAQIAGPASIIDGDTIDVSGRRIRLWGIDAPERAQICHAVTAGGPEAGSEYQCGRDASAALAAILRGKSVSCETRDRDRYGRTVAQCSTEAGDIGAEMVRQGWAVDYSQYSHGRYAAEETEARNAKRGIWSGRFDMPADWRRQHKGHR